MSTYSGEILVATVVVTVASLFVVFYPQNPPDNTIVPATTAVAPVEHLNSRNQHATPRINKGLYLKRDDGEAVKIQIQGASVGSFAPTHRRPLR